MFDHSKKQKLILPSAQHVILQKVALGLGFMLALQTALLVVLIFQQTDRSVEANRSLPDCIPQYGFNPKIPQSDGTDCYSVPISTAQKV